MLWCGCALLMQWMGLLHLYAHPSHADEAALHGTAVVDAGNEGRGRVAGLPAQPDGGALGDLFAGHDSNTVGCTLFDQLSHADTLIDDAMPRRADAAPTQAHAIHLAWHHAAQATGFLARGPPAIG